MDRIGGYYAECNKSEKDKYCMISLICGNTKIQQTSEYDKKKKADADIENKLVVTSGERE